MGYNKYYPGDENWKIRHYGLRASIGLKYEKLSKDLSKGFSLYLGLNSPHFFISSSHPRQVTGVNLEFGMAYSFEVSRRAVE